jgi:hypothetical protein
MDRHHRLARHHLVPLEPRRRRMPATEIGEILHHRLRAASTACLAAVEIAARVGQYDEF